MNLNVSNRAPLLPALTSYTYTHRRRAAHFAHFGADDEAEEEDNLHTGGNEVDNPFICSIRLAAICIRAMLPLCFHS